MGVQRILLVSNESNLRLGDLGHDSNGAALVSTTNLLIWSGAESAVTIIAASIPFLRLILREVSSKIMTPRLDVNYINQGSNGTNRQILAELPDVSRPRQPDDLSDDGLFAEEEKRGRVVFTGGRAKVHFDGY